MSQFSFGSSAPSGGGFSFGTPKTTAATGPTGFSFTSSAPSSSANSGGGFTFGTPTAAPASTQPLPLFSFTTPTTSAQSSGFSFVAPTPATSATSGVFGLGGNAPKLNLGSTGTGQPTGITGGFALGNSSGLGGTVTTSVPASQPAASSGFVFGSTTAATQPGTTGGFSFGSGATAPSGTPNFSLGSVGNSTQQPVATGLTFGVAPATISTAATTTPASQPVTAFSLGTQPAGSGFGLLGAAVAATSAPTGTLSQGPTLSFGAKLGGTAATSTAASTTTTPSLLGLCGPTLFASIANSSAPAPSAVNSLSLGASSAGTPTAGTVGFGTKVSGTTTVAAVSATTTASTTSAPSAGFTLNLKPPATTATVASTSAIATTTTTAPPVMTYAQLESLINKWSLELEDQEKHFLQQATQVNAWDRTLIENGEKITSLHREVEKVKLDQKRLDQELDFILSQQKELEDLLIPLEESVKEQSGTIYLQHADEEREKTYKLAENIDAQLKRMAQDLKDIIEHLNTSGGPADTSDPLQQICKILNAHMDSLQWIDQNSALLQRKVEEVTKVCESRRKEQERSFRITFD
ncbi:UNVERIFIED_CONTAM: hypothetical protein K2H54_031205 [Gekko kuhli]